MDTTFIVFYIILGLVLVRILTRIFGKFYKLQSEYDKLKEKAKMDLAQNPPAKRIPKEETDDYANKTPEEMIKALTPPVPTIYGGIITGGQFSSILPDARLGGGDPELMTRLEKKLKEAASQQNEQEEQENPRLVQYEKSLGIAPGYLTGRGGDPELVTRLQEKLKEAAEDQDRQE